MNVQFVEKYTRLGDIKEGETAVTKDREDFYVCGYWFCSLSKINKKVILNVNNLYNQHTDDVDLEQPVKILKSGERFVCEV